MNIYYTLCFVVQSNLFVFAVQQYFLLKYKNTCTADNNCYIQNK